MNMTSDMQKLIGASEEDEGGEEEIDMDYKDVVDDDDDKNVSIRYGNRNREVRSSRSGGGSSRSRPVEEKERTKLRERHRRAITARILGGLRRHGNFNLRVRADINDVIAALAREAGWVVLPDGTTFPSRLQPPPQGSRSSTDPSTPAATPSSQVLSQQIQASTFKEVLPGFQNSMEQNASQLTSVYLPTSPYDVSSSSQSHAASTIGCRGQRTDSHPLISGSVDTVDNKQVVDLPSRFHEHDFSGTPYVPVYVMLPLGVINMKCELTDPDALLNQLRNLTSINIDGVMVDCWWGIVEAHAPQEYNWIGYRRLFQIVRDLKLKLQVVMSFHECGGNFRDDVCIPLPLWVAEIGRSNPDIFFTDKEGRRNPECLSWGIDKERVLKGRTALEVYFDFMRSFRVEFTDFFDDGVISMIEIGLGPCGELRYPSCPVKHGWRYPGIGEFQCYDQYLLKSLRKTAEARGHPFWAKGPNDTGFYNSQPHETGFFCDGGEYDSFYGRFFLKWYSQVLIDHCDLILSLAQLAFEGTCIAAKIWWLRGVLIDAPINLLHNHVATALILLIGANFDYSCLVLDVNLQKEELSGLHWWYKTASHATELTAGFYNPSNRDGYADVMSVLKKHGAVLNYTSAEVGVSGEVDSSSEIADPDGLAWQVLNDAWDSCVPVASENSLPCHSREEYNKIVEKAKPLNDPDGRHLLSFAYDRLRPQLMERNNLIEFERFVKIMHGGAILDPPA